MSETIPSGTVKVLNHSDFALNSEEGIALKNQEGNPLPSCLMILFYVNNTDSMVLRKMWDTLAQYTAGTFYAVINLMENGQVADKINELKSRMNHPMYKFLPVTYPCILIYQNRFPVGVYNGPVDVQAIMDFGLVYACRGNYHEDIHAFAGQSLAPGQEMDISNRAMNMTNQTITSLAYGEQITSGVGLLNQALNPLTNDVQNLQPDTGYMKVAKRDDAGITLPAKPIPVPRSSTQPQRRPIAAPAVPPPPPSAEASSRLPPPNRKPPLIPRSSSFAFSPPSSPTVNPNALKSLSSVGRGPGPRR